MKKLTLIYLILFSLFAWCFQSHADDFSLNIDRSQIELGESLTVTYTYTGDTQGQSPDFNALKSNFNILSYRPTSQRFQINNDITLSTEWVIVLEPRAKGKLLIPPITFLGISSEAKEVTVNEQSAVPNKLEDIMLETIVDKSSVYVQEQLKLTYRLYYSVNIDQLDAEEISINDTIIKQLPTARYRRTINGVQYNVIELSHAILPQRSGTITIPQITWQARVARRSQGRYERVNRRSQEKIIRIKAIPDSFPVDATWLPARNLTVNERWSASLTNLNVGEPITRTLTLQASGLESAQLPVVLQDTSDNDIKVYVEPPKLSDDTNEFGLLAQRSESAALVLSSNNAVTLPEIRIPWWNTTTDTLEFITLPSQNVKANVLTPRANNTNNNIDQSISTQPVLNQPSIDTRPLQSFTFHNIMLAILFVTNIATLITLAVTIRRATLKKQASESKKSIHSAENHWKDLNNAAKAQDTMAFRAALTRWTKKHLGSSDITHLSIFARSQDLDSLAEAIAVLDNKLFGFTSDLQQRNVDFEGIIENLKYAAKKIAKQDSHVSAIEPFIAHAQS